MVQWLRICLPMQRMQVQPLIWEGFTGLKATKPMHHNYWVLCNKRSLQWEACTPQLEKACAQQHRPSTAQFSSVAQSCLALCDPMDCSAPGLPAHQQLPKFTWTHVHWVGDAIQPSHPLSSPSPPTFNPSQHQGLFKWVSSSNQVAKVLEFQL